MGAKIPYTHDGDLFRRLGVWIGSVVLVSLLGSILDPVARPIEHSLTSNGLHWAWVLLMWAYIICSYIIFVKILTKHVFSSWKTTLRYVQSFGVTISQSEAQKISFLVDGSLGNAWYPLDWLKEIQSEERRSQLFAFANKVAEKHGVNHPFPSKTHNPGN